MVAAYLLLCIIWGTTWSVIAVGLRGIPPFSGVAIRFAFAGAVLLLIARMRRLALGRSRVERRLWLVNALLAFCVSYGIVYWAEQWVPSGLVAVLFATYPVFLALLAHLALPDERLSWAELVGVLIAFGGVGVIFSTDFAALGGRQVAIASVVCLLSPLAAAISSVAVKRWGGAVHPISLSAMPMLLCGILMGFVAAATERDRAFTWDAVSISALLYLAIFGSAVTFTLYYWLLSHLTAKRMSLIAYVIPVVAVAIGTMRGEPLTTRVLLGAGVVLGGVAVTIHIQSRRGY